VPICKRVCSKYWDLKKVTRFSALVHQGFGYRLFVDDLPSATVSDGQTHYEWNVPLGFIPDKDPIEDESERKQRPYKPVAIYNHLEIKIKVHPTLKSNLVGSTFPKKVDVSLLGLNTSIDLPE
jgi:hypothetical protein